MIINKENFKSELDRLFITIFNSDFYLVPNGHGIWVRKNESCGYCGLFGINSGRPYYLIDSSDFVYIVDSIHLLKILEYLKMKIDIKVAEIMIRKYETDIAIQRKIKINHLLE